MLLRFGKNFTIVFNTRMVLLYSNWRRISSISLKVLPLLVLTSLNSNLNGKNWETFSPFITVIIEVYNLSLITFKLSTFSPSSWDSMNLSIRFCDQISNMDNGSFVVNQCFIHALSRWKEERFYSLNSYLVSSFLVVQGNNKTIKKDRLTLFIVVFLVTLKKNISNSMVIHLDTINPKVQNHIHMPMISLTVVLQLCQHNVTSNWFGSCRIKFPR